jgi:hypothetical protein
MMQLDSKNSLADLIGQLYYHRNSMLSVEFFRLGESVFDTTKKLLLLKLKDVNEICSRIAQYKDLWIYDDENQRYYAFAVTIGKHLLIRLANCQFCPYNLVHDESYRCQDENIHWQVGC